MSESIEKEKPVKVLEKVKAEKPIEAPKMEDLGGERRFKKDGVTIIRSKDLANELEAKGWERV
jgi:uncharacterized radical SAM superfamily Fe-S cluster-containing enzyme